MSIKRQIIEELHKPARKRFRRRRVIVKGLNDLYMADLVEMIPYAKINKGFRYILVLLNMFSKRVWACPLKRKTGEDVTKAMKKLLTSTGGTPDNLQTDMGKEFYNQHFRKLMQTFNINHYSTFSSMKASPVERVNRTLKNKMWKEFSMQGSYKWLQLLPKVVNQYNDTVHRTTGYKPIEVNHSNAKILLQTVYDFQKTTDLRSAKFTVGDHVRISKHREAFAKGYTPTWSTEIFQIKKVNRTNPITYILEDTNGEEIRGGFYTEELQMVKHPEVFLVEKVLKKREIKF